MPHVLNSKCRDVKGETTEDLVRLMPRFPTPRDAYSVAACMRCADLDGSLSGFLNPCMTPDEHEVARIEGWILGTK